MNNGLSFGESRYLALLLFQLKQWNMFYLQHMQYLQLDSIPGLLALSATALPTERKEISTNAVSLSRGGYEPTTVPITLCGGGRGIPVAQLICL